MEVIMSDQWQWFVETGEARYADYMLSCQQRKIRKLEDNIAALKFRLKQEEAEYQKICKNVYEKGVAA
jgi:hypothetical protein